MLLFSLVRHFFKLWKAQIVIFTHVKDDNEGVDKQECLEVWISVLSFFDYLTVMWLTCTQYMSDIESYCLVSEDAADYSRPHNLLSVDNNH